MTDENSEVLDVRAVTGYLCPYCGTFYPDMQLAGDCRQFCAEAKQSAGFEMGDVINLARENDAADYVVDQVKVMNRGATGRSVHYIVHRQGSSERIVLPAHVVRAAA